jgi:hypothetical protein
MFRLPTMSSRRALLTGGIANLLPLFDAYRQDPFRPAG